MFGVVRDKFESLLFRRYLYKVVKVIEVDGILE